ncbi:unnamed protein product [Cylicocyclus nassatus]|uniref:Uncharacterized protein n=1 Tax=Cylicocyclus nassatus TaxID=53992 RepID=A0AA36GQP1_CYLNA|nr:unnamed protein product [Cylicocyclus nassatus]
MSILSRISDTFHGVVDGLNNTFKVMNATVPAPAPLQSVNSGLEAGIKATTKFDNKVKDVAGAMYDNWIKPELDAKVSAGKELVSIIRFSPRLANSPVYDSEIYATTSSIEDHSVFGYQEGWASYRYAPNVVSGLMRPTSEGAFSTWTFADAYSTKPTLSAGWAREDPNIPNRVLAVTSDLSDQIFADFYFEAKWSRVMPMFSVPGAIGAF